MDSYLDIRVLPDPEFTAQALLDALFAKLHRALGQHAAGGIGISFPHAGKNLGDKLRLHGTSAALAAFHQLNWLKGLGDYTDCSAILPVPADAKHRTIGRVQVKSNAERLRRRAIKKGKLTEEEALQRIPDSVSQRSNLPFVNVKSLSNGERYPLFIRQGEIRQQASPGEFSSYGLSASATVPWF